MLLLLNYQQRILANEYTYKVDIRNIIYSIIMIAKKTPTHFTVALLVNDLHVCGATLIGWRLTKTADISQDNPEKLHRGADIHYRCKCGIEHRKNFRVLHKHGAYCKSCQAVVYSSRISEALTIWTIPKQKEELERLYSTLGFNKMEDWYTAKQSDFNENGLQGCLVGKYKGSPYLMLTTIYPDYPWNPILLKTKPQGFWNNPYNARLALEHIMNQKGWVSLVDLYKITRADIEADCSGLWDKFSSTIVILRYAYPEYEWKPYHLNTITKGTFNDIDNHRNLIKDLEKELHIQNPEEWIKHTSYKLFTSRGLGRLLQQYYNDSPSAIIFSIYPELRDKIHMLRKVPQHFYKDDSQIKLVMKQFELFKNITSPEGYYIVSSDDIGPFIGIGLERWGGLIDFIIHFVDVPVGFNWDKSKFTKHHHSKKQMEWLRHISISHPDMIHAENSGEYRIPGTRYKADGYDPSTNTVYEFHGDYWHGNPLKYDPSEINATTGTSYGDLFKDTQDRIEDIKSRGYSVVEMWELDWDQEKKTLVAI